MLLVIWLGFAIITALAAQARGRSFFGWLIIGLLTGLFGLIAVLVMQNLTAQQSSAQKSPVSTERLPAHAGQAEDLIKTYRGIPIRKSSVSNAGVVALEQYHANVIEAERAIDRALSAAASQ